ncbi:MAG: nicotinamide-nucleotide amidohydrolase family protein [Oscillospiraceae bacterium]|nr:nicotinamide-nucleotide amidohydrolase family protein [Oscillospiraceae bacterium]
MKQSLSAKVLTALAGKRLATAESLTGGGIGQALTSVSGASAVFAGGVISYTNAVKHGVLGVPAEMLDNCGAVSAPVAKAMAEGARRVIGADVAVAVTGLAGPDGDEYGNPVGTVFIGYADGRTSFAREYHFGGDRASVREQTVCAALELILEQN